jgi:hypothetical protein
VTGEPSYIELGVLADRARVFYLQRAVAAASRLWLDVRGSDTDEAEVLTEVDDPDFDGDSSCAVRYSTLGYLLLIGTGRPRCHVVDGAIRVHFRQSC